MPDVLIIVGSGNVGKSDIDHLECQGQIMAVGHGIEQFKGNIDAFAMWCVNGPMFNKAVEQREKEGLNTDFKCYSFFPNNGFEHCPMPLYGAGSAMYGIQIGINLGYDKIILVDCPLDDYCEGHQEGFKEAFPLIKDKVRAMSGFTKELFGEPDDEWLNS